MFNCTRKGSNLFFSYPIASRMILTAPNACMFGTFCEFITEDAKRLMAPEMGHAHRADQQRRRHQYEMLTSTSSMSLQLEGPILYAWQGMWSKACSESHCQGP